ncbi:3'-5' exonuclease [Streptomonospora litoralis]|uniref:DNA polymerase III PolC-type n=1 Tax=Streptomonospora litoralis TaxID=2498135 RepID=A0A4P6Q570_9ACTN|nr:3'-5' exonuclease [Streptomonospora litoralis]QBI55753.1 DNA polymerase III PolC-type [Streptomonospora litoralis]
MDDVLDAEPDAGRVVRMGTLTRRRGSARSARDLEYAVVDVETTGLYPGEGARICEIAVVRMRGDGTLLREFSTLVDPGVPITGQEFHGIGASDVVGAPKASELVGVLRGLFSGAVLAGHKLDFEGRFLASELLPAGLPGELPGLCTLLALRAQVDLPRYSLPRACHTLSGHWPTGQHTALGDARACAQLLAELLTNAPGTLRYTGPDPMRLKSAEPDFAGLKPRTAHASAASSVALRRHPERPPVSWPSRWRRLELDPRDCVGRFTTEQRAAAQRQAECRSAYRDAAAASAALTSALAATSAARLLARRLRSALA